MVVSLMSGSKRARYSSMISNRPQFMLMGGLAPTIARRSANQAAYLHARTKQTIPWHRKDPNYSICWMKHHRMLSVNPAGSAIMSKALSNTPANRLGGKKDVHDDLLCHYDFNLAGMSAEGGTPGTGTLPETGAAQTLCSNIVRLHYFCFDEFTFTETIERENPPPAWNPNVKGRFIVGTREEQKKFFLIIIEKNNGEHVVWLPLHSTVIFKKHFSKWEKPHSHFIHHDRDLHGEGGHDNEPQSNLMYTSCRGIQIGDGVINISAPAKYSNSRTMNKSSNSCWIYPKIYQECANIIASSCSLGNIGLPDYVFQFELQLDAAILAALIAGGNLCKFALS
jgi:hypothetical protein